MINVFSKLENLITSDTCCSIVEETTQEDMRYILCAQITDIMFHRHFPPG